MSTGGGGGGSSWPPASSPLPTLPSSLVYPNNKKENAESTDADCKKEQNRLQLTTAETCLRMVGNFQLHKQGKSISILSLTRIEYKLKWEKRAKRAVV
jgi:hypothetical protein